MSIQVKSFHILKDEIGSRKAVAENAQFIGANLAAFLEVTKKAVQLRFGKALKTESRLPHEKMRDKGERHLEASMLAYWKHDTGNIFLPEICPWLLGNQIPLANKQGADSWGKVDLLGMSADFKPVIIELKAGTAGDSPLRAIIEGVGYAVAMRTNWIYYTKALSTPPEKAWAEHSSNSPIGVVVAAPEEFWQRLNRSSARYKEVADALPALVALAQKLSQKGYPVWFCSIRTSVTNSQVSGARAWPIGNLFWPYGS